MLPRDRIRSQHDGSHRTATAVGQRNVRVFECAVRARSTKRATGTD
jgi:hypothetical protein